MIEEQDTIEELLTQIREFCSSHTDPQKIAKYAPYFKEGYDPYGVPDEALAPKKREWLKSCKHLLTLPGVFILGDRLFQSGKYEEGFLAIFFLRPFLSQFTLEAFQRLGRWLEFGVHNWAHCDTLCGDLLSTCLENGIVAFEAMAGWRGSAFKYKRRAVPVSSLRLIKQSKDIAPLLDFLRPLMCDAERVVQQGMGWFLREAWKVYPQMVEAFLLEWKGCSPRLIFQYAAEKMSPEGKARFRRK